MVAPIIVQAGAPRVFTVEQVAELLCCSMDHVSHLIEVRRLCAVNLALKDDRRALYRVPLAGLQRFLQEAVVL